MFNVHIQCIEIRVQWTVHLGSSHMHVHAVTRVHAVTPKLVICVMYLTSIAVDGFFDDRRLMPFDRMIVLPTQTLIPRISNYPQSITATRLDQLVYSPNYYIQIRLKIIARSEKRTFTLSESWALCHYATRAIYMINALCLFLIDYWYD